MNSVVTKPLTFEECPKHELKMSSLLTCFHFALIYPEILSLCSQCLCHPSLVPFFLKKNLLDHLCMGMWSYEAFQALAGQKIIFLFCLIETLGRDRILSICPKLSPLKNFRKYYSIIPCSEKSLILMRKC